MVADLIIESGIGRIPIIDPQSRTVLGILSRHDLLKARQASQLAEKTRARFFPLRKGMPDP